jgi:hypothetical protein
VKITAFHKGKNSRKITKWRKILNKEDLCRWFSFWTHKAKVTNNSGSEKRVKIRRNFNEILRKRNFFSSVKQFFLWISKILLSNFSEKKKKYTLISYRVIQRQGIFFGEKPRRRFRIKSDINIVNNSHTL